jgi:hypothetical protein
MVKTIYDLEEEDRQVTLPGGISASEAALPAYLANQFRGIEAGTDLLGFDSSTVKGYQQQQEDILANYRPRVESLFQAKNVGEGFEWWKDQATLNSMNQILPMIGYVSSGILKAIPSPYTKLAGNLVFTGTFATQYNANLGDTLQEHEERAGRELTKQEKLWAGGVSGLVTALDYLTPGKVSKDVVKQMGGMKNVTKVREQLLKQLKQQKENLGTSVKKGVGYVGKVTALEAGTEGLQKGVQIGTSVDPGYLGTQEGLESIVQEAVAAGPVSGIISTPAAVSKARETNRTLNQAVEQANRLNTELLAQGNVNEFIKNRITDIPEKVGFAKRFEDVQKKLQTIGDVGVFKAPMQIKRERDFVLNNQDIKDEDKPKAYQLLNKTLQRYLGVSNMSGEQQIQESFDSRKATITGELLAETTEILNRLSNKTKLGLGAPVVSKEINDYIRQVFKGEKSENSRPDLVPVADMKKLLAARKVAGEKLQQTTGIDLVENYISQPVSVEAIKNDTQGFVDSLIASSKEAYNNNKNKDNFNPDAYIYNEDPVVARQNAEAIADDIINGRDPNAVTSKYIKDQMGRGREGQGKQSFEKARSEQWAKLDDKYREQDVGRILEGYFQRAAARIASAETFGAKNASELQKDLNELGKMNAISQDTADRVWDLYDAVHNNYRSRVGKAEQDLRKASRYATQVAAITHLGLATISSLTELVWVGERAGFGNMLMTMPKAFDYTMKGVKKGLGGKPMKESEGWRTLANLGINLNPHVNDRLDQMFSTDRSSLVNAYFRSPFGSFLTQWTNFNRNWAAQAALMNWNRRAKRMVQGNIDPMDKRRLENELRENGITMDEFQKIADLSKKYNEGNIGINVINDKFLNENLVRSNGATTRVRDIIVPWLHKTVDEVVVHPRATNKPLWMSDPSFSTIAQLKTFPIVFGNTVVKRLLRKLNPKNCTTDMGLAVGAAGAMAMAFGVAFVAEQIKAGIKGQDPRDLSWLDYGNLTGLTGAGGLFIGAGKYGDVTTSLLGPTLDTVFNKTYAEILNPFFEGDFDNIPGNLIDWFAGSVDSSLGPAGIHFQPAGTILGVDDE